MDIDSLLNIFLSDQQAVLPSALLQYGGLYLAWTLVLAWGISTLMKHWSARSRWLSTAAVAMLTVVPGPTSPAYWLGLAFQSPSVTSALLALWGLSLNWRNRSMKEPVKWGQPSLALCAMGAALGWVLLLDTFARWPVSVYAWGFSPVAVAATSLILVIGWAIGEGAQRWRSATRGFLIPAIAVVVFVGTRWPTGNVWDALLDPWLWVWLQCLLLANGFRKWRQRGSPTIQA